jgi:hypothetical protein
VSALLHQLERPAIANASGEVPRGGSDANPQGESAVDFEALLSSLGASGQALPPLMEMLLASPSNSVLQSLASVRTQLSSDAPVDPGPAPQVESAREAAMTSSPGPRRNTRAAREIAALERWLRVLQTPSADPHAHRPA